MKIYRARSPLLAFLVGFGLLLMVILLQELGFISIEEISNWIVRVFMAAFILPALVILYLAWWRRREPLIIIANDSIELRSGVLFSRSIVIPRRQIKAVFTEWEGPDSDTSTDIIFTVEKEFAPFLRESRVFTPNDNLWHFNFSDAEMFPLEAVELLRRQIGL